MTTEQKFNAAVNVIRSLPKNGSYQPSNELMLRFYSYYKQATQGPCTASRPPFWDVVGKAKYDVWKQLGDMSREQAMAKYVEELHSIVETMSYSDKVANFLEAPTTELDRINMDDLELVAGDVMERVRSQPNSPLASREASPIRFGSRSLGSSPESRSIQDEDSDRSDDEYIDTIENPEPRKPNLSHETSNGHVSRPRTKAHPAAVDVSHEVSRAVQSLKADLDKLSTRVNVLEAQVQTRSARSPGRSFSGLNVSAVAFMVLWPFVVSFVMGRLWARRS